MTRGSGSNALRSSRIQPIRTPSVLSGRPARAPPSKARRRSRSRGPSRARGRRACASRTIRGCRLGLAAPRPRTRPPAIPGPPAGPRGQRHTRGLAQDPAGRLRRFGRHGLTLAGSEPCQQGASQSEKASLAVRVSRARIIHKGAPALQSSQNWSVPSDLAKLGARFGGYRAESAPSLRRLLWIGVP